MPINPDRDVRSLSQLAMRFDEIKKRMWAAGNDPLFPKVEQPDDDGFQDLPEDISGMSNQELEEYLFIYQRWLEYYEDRMAWEESELDRLQAIVDPLRGAVYDDMKERKVATAGELQRVKIIHATEPFIHATEEVLSQKYRVRKMKRVLSQLSKRSSKLSRIIELRRGPRRGAPDDRFDDD